MTDLIESIKLSNYDTPFILTNNQGSHGTVWLDINDVAVCFDYRASVKPDETNLFIASIYDLNVKYAIQLDDDGEPLDDADFTLTDDLQSEVTEYLELLIERSDNNVNISKYNADLAYDHI